MIEAKLMLTEEIILRGFELHAKYRQRFLKYVPFLGAVLTLASLLNLFRGDSILTVFPVLLPGLFLLGMPTLMKQIAKRNVSRLPTLGKEISWQLNKQGLTGHTARGEFSQVWSNLDDALISDEGILIYSQKVVTHWLPKIAFASETDFQQAKQYVQNGIQRHQIV